MTTIAYSPVNIQTSALSVPSIPAWFGEITLMAHYLQHQGVLAAIEEQVRFARRILDTLQPELALLLPTHDSHQPIS